MKNKKIKTHAHEYSHRIATETKEEEEEEKKPPRRNSRKNQNKTDQIEPTTHRQSYLHVAQTLLTQALGI